MEKDRGRVWPVLVVCVLAMAGAIALAQLLIPQLSVAAAVRGGTIAIGVFLATRLIPLAVRRFRQRRNRE